MSLQTGVQIAQTSRPIIDPRDLTIVAFYCEGPRLDVNPAILHIEDIREFSNLGFIVDSAQVIMSPNDLVRLQQVIGFNFALDDKLVVDDAGRKIGKVSNYSLDSRSFYIMQIYAQPTIWSAWNTAEVVISRQQIIQIDDAKIIVKSPTIPKKATASRQQLVQNPFSNHSPQPEATHAAQEKS